MKMYTPLYLLLVLVCMVQISCKQKKYDYNEYNMYKDTIRPVLTVTVPVDLDNYSYGENIHIVGTATDLESKNPISIKAGKLSSLHLQVSIIDPLADTVKQIILDKYPNVNGKEGFTFNEKTAVFSGAGATYCRLKGMLIDYAGRKDSALINFTIN